MNFKQFWNSAFVLFFWGISQAQAWTEPGITYTTGFFSMSSKDSFGTDVKLSSKPAIDLRPDLTFVMNSDYDRLIFRGFFKEFAFDVSGTIESIAENETYYFGLGADFQRIWGLGQYTFGLDIRQHPFASAIDATHLKLTKLFVLSLPVEFSRKLLILERQVIRAGADGAVILPIMKDVISGYRARAFLRHELRSTIKIESTFFYEMRSTQTTSVSQSEIEMGFNFRISFPGRRGLTPPPNERE